MGGQFSTLHLDETRKREMEDAIEDYLIDEVIWQWTLPLPPFTAATVDQAIPQEARAGNNDNDQGNDSAENSTSAGPAKRKRNILASLSKEERKQQKGVPFPEAKVQNVEYKRKKVEDGPGTVKKGKKDVQK